MIRSELRVVVAEEVNVDLSSAPVSSNNPDVGSQDISWPHELPTGERTEEQDNRPKIPIFSKWGVKFDATPKTPAIEDFIFRVDRLQKSYGCPDHELVDGFHHLLEGRPNKWYWDRIQQQQHLHTNVDVLRQIMDRK